MGVGNPTMTQAFLGTIVFSCFESKGAKGSLGLTWLCESHKVHLCVDSCLTEEH